MSIRKFVASFEDAIVSKGVSAETIKEAELMLGVTFAADYKEYLSTCGVLAANGHELTGLGGSKRVSVVDVTVEKRSFVSADDLYVIEDISCDNAIAWQSAEGQVLISYFDHGPEPYCNDLNAYLSK